MGQLILYGAMSLVFAVLFIWLHTSNGRWCVFVFLFLTLVVVLLGHFQPAVTLLLLAVFSVVIRKDSNKRFRIAGAAVISIGVTAFYSTGGRWETAYAIALQKEFPVVSIADQLSYENKVRHRSTSPASLASASNELAPDVESQLEQREDLSIQNSMMWGSRSEALALLHQEGYADFVASPDFGMGRIPFTAVRRAHIELPPSKPVSQPDFEAVEESEEPSYTIIGGEIARNETSDEVDDLADAKSADERAAQTEALTTAHTAGEMDFLHPDRIGYVTEKQKVAGFTPHGFRKPVLVGSKKEPARWQVTQLQLISLLRFEEPLAYVSDHLPDMVELKETLKTRPLNAFEAAALSRLATEEDIVIQEEPGLISMLGSLRAGNDCLKCHNVKRGHLLVSVKANRKTPVGPASEPHHRRSVPCTLHPPEFSQPWRCPVLPSTR